MKVYQIAILVWLFTTVSAPLESDWQDVVDLPQVRGLNILNGLFSDRGLTENLQPYVARALMHVIEGFGSPNWSVRNGCMRFLGTLTQRIFGMKKVQDAFGDHDLIANVRLETYEGERYFHCPPTKK